MRGIHNNSWRKVSNTLSTLAFAFWLPTMPLPMGQLLFEESTPCQSAVSHDANSALKTKADKLSKMLYTAALQNDVAPKSAALTNSIETSLAQLAQIADFRRDSQGSIIVNMAVQLETANAAELYAAGFAVGGLLGNIATVQTNANRLPALAALRSVRKISVSTYGNAANDRAAQGIGATATDGSRLLAQTGKRSRRRHHRYGH